MKTKIILAIVAVALMAAALIGVSAAQFANQTPIANVVNGQVELPCVTGGISQVPVYGVNATAGEPCYFQNGTLAGYGYGLSGAGDGAFQNGYCNGFGYGVGEQEQFQYRYGGMMGGSGYGFGCGR